MEGYSKEESDDVRQTECPLDECVRVLTHVLSRTVAMGNSQQKLHYNRMQMRRKRCRTARARRDNAGRKKR